MTFDASTALAGLPGGLRKPLVDEYRELTVRYQERRWSPAELGAGRFSEIVYTILEGHAAGSYASKPTKPKDFVAACRKLEQNTQIPRSFQILIPRLLPALYEVRNNRGVGHVGGDVDPNHMDAQFVVSAATAGPVQVDDLLEWTGYQKRPYFLRVLRQLHRNRLIELSRDEAFAELLPPGAARLEELAAARRGGKARERRGQV